MPKLVKDKTLLELMDLIGKKLRFRSNCDLFPDFDIIGTVLSIKIKNQEPLINIRTEKNKKLTISGNMKNLSYENA